MENEEGQDRLVLHENEPVFENLPNFRQAGGRGLKTRSGRKVKDGLLFRSSRTDFVTRRDTGRFQELGIKTIVDLRRQSEYERSDGDKILDSMYQVRVLKDGRETSMKPSLRWGKKSTDESSGIPLGQRLLVNMWTMDLIWHTFYKLNFFLRWLSLVLVGIDWVFGTHFFVKLYTWLVINETSLAEQYMEVLEFTKPVIADILRLLSRKEHLPALIHCAHGKDRTGIIVMLVMGCLGVEEDQIVSDYAKSEVSNQGQIFCQCTNLFLTC